MRYMLAAIICAVAGYAAGIALADFTVNKTMSQSFQMYNSDGTYRTNCDLTKFSARTFKNNVRVTLAWTFRNQSTGDYTMTATPTSAGYYKAVCYFSNTTVGSFTDEVRNEDVDTIELSATGDARQSTLSNMSTSLGRFRRRAYSP